MMTSRFLPVNIPGTPVTPAQRLVGKLLNDWLVIEMLGSDDASTGGFFSTQYRARHVGTGQVAFLKAIDLNRRQELVTPEEKAARVAAGLRHFEYESSLLKLCDGRSMDRIVRALDSGVHVIELPEYGATLFVPFIVFEEAKCDLRHHPETQVFNLSWRLQIFHGVAVAMSQLHSAEIAHQDLKPSNVLVFENDFAKVGDLGRATDRKAPSDYELPQQAGDRNYTPFELLYGEYLEGSWERRRLGADLFMMGCLLTYLMCDSSFLVLTFERLDRQFWPAQWGGGYERVIPHLQSAIEAVLTDIETALPKEFGSDICSFIYQLCNPDPRARGWPHQCDNNKQWSHRGQLGPILAQYNLERTISHFNALATKARLLGANGKPFGNLTRFWNWFLENNR